MTIFPRDRAYLLRGTSNDPWLSEVKIPYLPGQTVMEGIGRLRKVDRLGTIYYVRADGLEENCVPKAQVTYQLPKLEGMH